jgi:hypothetical protein
MNSVANDDEQEMTLREWTEEWERKQQERDEQAVEQFLTARLKQKGGRSVLSIP